MKKRLLSGIKPTGDIHIGNYFGAMKQFVDLQDAYENFIFIADYHALNQIKNSEELSRYTLEIAKAFIAIGLDPKKTALFKQSDIPPVTELCWIFNSLTPLSMLKRAHAFKDAQAKKTEVNMGLFDYPVLMAADILIYDSDVVPVGKDQKQHLEIAQSIARIFNNQYGKTFKIPQEMISKDVAIIKGLDGRKMSKSYKNTIGLFDSKESVAKKVMTIVTDSQSASEPKNPNACTIFSLHKLFSKNNLAKLEKRYREGSISYKESKEVLIGNINTFLEPIRAKKAELDENSDLANYVLKQGKERVLKIAQRKINEVKIKIGVSPDL